MLFILHSDNNMANKVQEVVAVHSSDSHKFYHKDCYLNDELIRCQIQNQKN